MTKHQLTVAVFVCFVCIGFLLGAVLGGSDVNTVRMVS